MHINSLGKMRNLLTYLLAGFFVIAGINHFISPEFYLPLIPDYLPFPNIINVVSGIVEIIAGVGLLLPSLKKYAAWLVIVLMIMFIPSHVYFIQIGSCIDEGLCVPAWVAWARLIIIHPLLIYWAWYVKK